MIVPQGVAQDRCFSVAWRESECRLSGRGLLLLADLLRGDLALTASDLAAPVIRGRGVLERALAALWPEVPAQRCTVRKHPKLLGHAPDTLHEEFKRRIETQTVLPSAETAAMLFWALLASGPAANASRFREIAMRKADGWQTPGEKLADPVAVDLAA